MFLDLVLGVVTVANAFIALFIVVYAFLFLNKTKSHIDRRPWDYLFLSSIIYLLYTMFLMMLEIYGVKILFGTIHVYELSVFFQFIYTGLILLSFISQTDLIVNNELIVIVKKQSGKDDVKRMVEGAGVAKLERDLSKQKPARQAANVRAAEDKMVAKAASSAKRKGSKKKK
ncbi:hypothetical protein JW826_01340 [Candidatus Woesearchaeota archaeon]|nr:hypothetical protein [Candidatus Woesearchaeota archaeon]